LCLVLLVLLATNRVTGQFPGGDVGGFGGGGFSGFDSTLMEHEPELDGTEESGDASAVEPKDAEAADGADGEYNPTTPTTAQEEDREIAPPETCGSVRGMGTSASPVLYDNILDQETFGIPGGYKFNARLTGLYKVTALAQNCKSSREGGDQWVELAISRENSKFPNQLVNHNPLTERHDMFSDKEKDWQMFPFMDTPCSGFRYVYLDGQETLYMRYVYDDMDLANRAVHMYVMRFCVQGPVEKGWDFVGAPLRTHRYSEY